MRSSVAWLLTFAAIVACNGLKDAAEAPPDEGDAGAPPDDGAPGSDAGGARAADAGPDGAAAPPPDFECADAWVTTTKKKSECAPRQVTIVDSDIAIDATGVSIARTSAGRIGIVYNSETTAESGEMRLVHFVPTTSSFTPHVIKRAQGDYAHAGYTTKIAASPPDTLHVLAHDVDDVSSSGDVVEVRLVDGTEPLSVPDASDLVASAVKRPTELALAIDGSGTRFATLRIATGTTDAGGTVARLAAATKPAAAGFSAMPDLATGLLPDEAPGTGAASLAFDGSGQLAVLFHHCNLYAHSTPRYRTFNGTSWSYEKTIDNAAFDGLAGYSPRVAAHGPRKTAAYFFRKAGQSTPATAELHLATWTLPSDTPVVEIVDTGIPSVDPMAPHYQVAMAVDRFGLVHLAIIRPESATSGYLEYRRQVPVAGGGTKWLSDIVDPDVLSDASDAFVDMIVDDAVRPHIAYRSGKDLEVRYATRYDR